MGVQYQKPIKQFHFRKDTFSCVCDRDCVFLQCFKILNYNEITHA